MLKISKKVVDRITAALKTFQSIALSHKSRDVSEADTCCVVKALRRMQWMPITAIPRF